MMLTINGLTKSFGGLTAVNEVDAVIEKGTITAVIGPNGAGKSTFFHLISGFHQPTKGSIQYNGSDITKTPPHKTAALGISRTFQTTHLFEQSTVIDNVLIGHRVRTKATIIDAIFRTKREKNEEKKCYEKAREMLDFVGLSHLENNPVHSITQEEQKRTAIALALATDPELLLLDEPAAGINPDETIELASLIKKIVRNGVTVCLIEHKMPMIMSLADHIIVLNHGSKIAEGTPEEIKNNPEVIKAYLGGEENVETG
ncbi:ABC transporter ATP-binding protein [Thalassorhabdus alkalitolerans]|uniref:ABC transporter ATP-binding protein n=1 Tax=Thalassorhabdus alkalitolerans TaxID=2282697 RepID=A0ABW0YKQ9_9BACI